MQFLNPIWLLGISGILIAILIHLWNVRPGKVMKVGSILLMGESSKQNSRSFKLQDLWLLLIRCLIILLLSSLLAEPVIKSNSVSRQKGLILIPPGQVQDAHSQYQKEIDSLLEWGFEFRLFQPGFEKSDLKTQLEAPEAPAGSGLSYRSLMRDFLYKNPEAREVWVYTDRLLKNLGGETVSLPRDMRWKTFPAKNSSLEWIHSAWVTPADSIRAVLARSDSMSTAYRIVDLGYGQSNSELQFDVSSGKPRISFKEPSPEKDSNYFQLDTSNIRIGIYGPDNPGDLLYLKSALEAIQTFTSYNIALNVISEQQVPKDLDFIFWLSDKSLPQGIPQMTTIFRYKKGDLIEANSTLSDAANPGSMGKEIDLFRKVKDPVPDQGIGIWNDATGSAVLKKTIYDGQTSFEFFSRFNPSWNDLVWSAQFPEMLLEILITDRNTHSDSHDLRTINPDFFINYQEKVQRSQVRNSDQISYTSLSNLFALVLIGLICLERWIAQVKMKHQNA